MFKNSIGQKTQKVLEPQTPLPLRKGFLHEDSATKSDDFLEKFQTPFDPPPHFSKIILHFL